MMTGMKTLRTNGLQGYGYIEAWRIRIQTPCVAASSTPPQRSSPKCDWYVGPGACWSQKSQVGLLKCCHTDVDLKAIGMGVGSHFFLKKKKPPLGHRTGGTKNAIDMQSRLEYQSAQDSEYSSTIGTHREDIEIGQDRLNHVLMPQLQVPYQNSIASY